MHGRSVLTEERRREIQAFVTDSTMSAEDVDMDIDFESTSHGPQSQQQRSSGVASNELLQACPSDRPAAFTNYRDDEKRSRSSLSHRRRSSIGISLEQAANMARQASERREQRESSVESLRRANSSKSTLMDSDSRTHASPPLPSLPLPAPSSMTPEQQAHIAALQRQHQSEKQKLKAFYETQTRNISAQFRQQLNASPQFPGPPLPLVDRVVKPCAYVQATEPEGLRSSQLNGYKAVVFYGAPITVRPVYNLATFSPAVAGAANPNSLAPQTFSSPRIQPPPLGVAKPVRINTVPTQQQLAQAGPRGPIVGPLSRMLPGKAAGPYAKATRVKLVEGHAARTSISGHRKLVSLTPLSHASPLASPQLPLQGLTLRTTPEPVHEQATSRTYHRVGSEPPPKFHDRLTPPRARTDPGRSQSVSPPPIDLAARRGKSVSPLSSLPRRRIA